MLAAEKSFSVTFLGINQEDSIAHDWLSSFPTLVKDVRRSFAIMPSGQARCAIIAEVVCCGRFFYVVEVERNHLRKSDKFSTRVMHAKGFSRLDEAFFITAMAGFVEKLGSWKGMLENSHGIEIIIGQINHTSEKPEKSTEKIYKWIKNSKRN